MKPQRVLTGYRLLIDPKTCELLRGSEFSVPNIFTASITNNSLEYVVAWEQDNEYVHTNVMRHLRKAIRDKKGKAE